MRIPLESKEKQHITVEHQGKKHEEVINKRVSGWVWGNLVFLWGGIITTGVDYMTGKAWVLERENVNANFN